MAKMKTPTLKGINKEFDPMPNLRWFDLLVICCLVTAFIFNKEASIFLMLYWIFLRMDKG